MSYEISWRKFRTHKNEQQLKKLSRYVNNIVTVFKSYGDNSLQEMSFEDRLKVLDKCERISLAIRSSLELQQENEILESVPEGYKLSQVAISLEGKTLRIETPLTTVRGVKNSSYIASCVAASLDVFEQENSLKLSDVFDEPVSVTQIRKITKRQFCGTGIIKDNNNEDSKIINAIIYDKLLKVDTVYFLRSFTNTTQVVDSIDKTGMELIITSCVDT